MVTGSVYRQQSVLPGQLQLTQMWPALVLVLVLVREELSSQAGDLVPHTPGPGHLLANLAGTPASINLNQPPWGGSRSSQRGSAPASSTERTFLLWSSSTRYTLGLQPSSPGPGSASSSPEMRRSKVAVRRLNISHHQLGSLNTAQ